MVRRCAMCRSATAGSESFTNARLDRIRKNLPGTYRDRQSCRYRAFVYQYDRDERRGGKKHIAQIASIACAVLVALVGLREFLARRSLRRQGLPRVSMNRERNCFTGSHAGLVLAAMAGAEKLRQLASGGSEDWIYQSRYLARARRNGTLNACDGTIAQARRSAYDSPSPGMRGLTAPRPVPENPSQRYSL